MTINDHRKERTRSALSHFLRRDREDVQHLDHDLYYDVLHRVCRRHGYISLKTFEEVFDTLEEIDERILAGFNIFGRLIDFIVRITSTQRSKTMLTERSTPIPEKITDAGEKTCEIGDE